MNNEDAKCGIWLKSLVVGGDNKRGSSQVWVTRGACAAADDDRAHDGMLPRIKIEVEGCADLSFSRIQVVTTQIFTTVVATTTTLQLTTVIPTTVS